MPNAERLTYTQSGHNFLPFSPVNDDCPDATNNGLSAARVGNVLILQTCNEGGNICITGYTGDRLDRKDSDYD